MSLMSQLKNKYFIKNKTERRLSKKWPKGALLVNKGDG